MIARFILALSVCLAAVYGAECVLPAGSIVQVALDANAPKSLKKAGAVADGSLSRPFYNANCLVLPAGSRVRAAAEGTGMRLELRPANAPAIAAKATLVRMAAERHVEAGGKAGARKRMLLARLEQPLGPLPGEEMPLSPHGKIATGTEVRVALETAAGSRRSRNGDVVQARVLEPVMIGERILVPEGAVIEGAVANPRRARRLYRAGGLRLSFHSLRFSRTVVVVPMNVAAARLRGGALVDAEGGVTGGALTRKRALINLGIAYATGKILDDAIEEGAKAALGAAVAGSAETVARYVGLGAGVAVFLMHRGRDVTLDPYTELVLTFSRDLEINN